MSRWPETHESLICRVKDPHDELAWNQFMTIYRPVIYRLAREKGLQHADSEDLVQRVFTSLAQAMADWEPRQNGPLFRNWLGRIARNAILNALSRAKPDRPTGSTTVNALLNEIPVEGETDSVLLRESRLQAFRWAAGEVEREFNKSTWIMFRETAIEGRSVSEVALQVGKTAGAVYIARCRVMQRIKEKIDEIPDIWSVS
ncbi:sigma-70 family RNA polymerase sigma factor [Blastopirellula marina]|uniref:RNA polymerase subunit sigma n=1 Tax=Blastopirellula marina TaxID=124 RepID=A0A2S8G2E7_9BACT|nr:sigma-70 family RNA polymerase sigma factor [Blastopirellula marina]PQO38617.1 RNA polymerase subunit sigma [Blastopirellula marina]PTL45274.1 sigma-70 family RNA polymerase sigma factor [Blastopirellula marina]